MGHSGDGTPCVGCVNFWDSVNKNCSESYAEGILYDGDGGVNNRGTFCHRDAGDNDCHYDAFVPEIPAETPVKGGKYGFWDVHNSLKSPLQAKCGRELDT